jgi:invasion protein IalB
MALMLSRIAIAMLLLATLVSAQERKPAESKAGKPAPSKASPALAWAAEPTLEVASISGSLAVSNETDADLDETVLVVAVNEIGKAFAIGYQHFTLQSHKVNVPIPFGLKLPPGRYMVHADAISEILTNHKVFHFGLQTPASFVITVI